MAGPVRRPVGLAEEELEKPELAKFGDQFRRHRLIAVCRHRQVRRRILDLEIAPSLENPHPHRLHRENLGGEDNAACRLAVEDDPFHDNPYVN